MIFASWISCFGIFRIANDTAIALLKVLKCLYCKIYQFYLKDLTIKSNGVLKYSPSFTRCESHVILH